MIPHRLPDSPDLIAFPAYQLLVLEERLKEQESEGVEMSAEMKRDELALRILIAAALMQTVGRGQED